MGFSIDRAAAALLVFALLGASSCAKNASDSSAGNCAPDSLQASKPASASATGNGLVFVPDPIVRSGNPALSPTSLRLDDFRSPVTLSHLGGNGVLEGSYVDVRNNTGCNGWFGAYDPSGQFTYSHSDSRFQEVMAYYYGDTYRASLDRLGTGFLQPAAAVKIVAHCEAEDNAYFVRQHDPTTGQAIEYVCLGDSVVTPGASYADDGIVTVHELEHATTIDSYSVSTDLNQLWYDEAGALNEAISDFMGLLYEVPLLPVSFDARLFSRWALGTFIPNQNGTRGAHKCPAYDSSYPNCTGFPGFSAANNTISYVYPDGIGWPYANNYPAPGFASAAYSTYKSQEEIHNAGVLMEGSLWDVYEALKANHVGDEQAAHDLSTKLVLEAIKHMPLPTASVLSPVTFRGFATQLASAATLLQLSPADQASVTQALTTRGLLGGTPVDPSWLAVGPGNAGVTPGIRVQDNPSLLKTWVYNMTGSPNAASIIPQGIATGLNGQLDPGELDAVWFDLQNNSAVTAGAVTITVTVNDPDVRIDPEMNIGYLSATQAQMIYGKVNGTAVVSALSSANPTYNVPAGNTYFKTNPFFDHRWTTAIWIRVSPTAAHGKTVTFQVSATPSNGPAATQSFTAKIN